MIKRLGRYFTCVVDTHQTCAQSDVSSCQFAGLRGLFHRVGAAGFLLAEDIVKALIQPGQQAVEQRIMAEGRVAHDMQSIRILPPPSTIPEYHEY